MSDMERWAQQAADRLVAAGEVPPNADYGRVIDWPKALRGTADWLDTVDEWLIWALPVLSRIQDQPDGLAEALECVRGQQMQDDLRRLAEILEASPNGSYDPMVGDGSIYPESWLD